MRLHLAASEWITESPSGVRLRFWADPAAGPPPAEIGIERAVLVAKRPSWVRADDDPGWLGAPASWWTASRTIRLTGDPLVAWALGSAVQGVAFVYDGRRALIRASLAGTTVWSRTVEPSETVHIAAPCDRVAIRAVNASLRSARLLDPAAHAGELSWVRVATVLVRLGLSRPWSAVEPRVRGLLTLDEPQWRALAAAVAARYDRLLPAGASFEASEREIILQSAWKVAAACGFGWRDGPGASLAVDDVDRAALLGSAPSVPLAYRIVDPEGRWLASAPVAVPAGALPMLATPRAPSVAARVRLADDGGQVAERLLSWRLGDARADRAAFEQKIGDSAPEPEWEIRARVGALADDVDQQVSTLRWPSPLAPVAMRQRAGDPWGRWSTWSEWTHAVPDLEHHPAAPPLLAAFATQVIDRANLTIRLGTIEPPAADAAIPSAPPWQADRLTLALHGRVQVMRRLAPPEVVDVVIEPLVGTDPELLRFAVIGAFSARSFIGGVLAAGGLRCEIVRTEPRAILVRRCAEAASRWRTPDRGPARLIAPKDRADLWQLIGETDLPVANEFALFDREARGGAVYALRIAFDHGVGPLGAQVVAEGTRAPIQIPPGFSVDFRGFGADRRATVLVAFDSRPAATSMRIGWTWADETTAAKRFDTEPLLALDGDRLFLARISVPDRADALPFLNIWIAGEDEQGIGVASGPAAIGARGGV